MSGMTEWRAASRSETMTKDELERRKYNLMSLCAVSVTRERSREKDYIETIEQAWDSLAIVDRDRDLAALRFQEAEKARDDAIKARDFLTGQNTELLEDIEAMRKEQDALKAELQSWCDGSRIEEIIQNGGYIKVGLGSVLISRSSLDEKDAEIKALKEKVGELEVWREAEMGPREKGWCP